jgi:hypothetical protein
VAARLSATTGHSSPAHFSIGWHGMAAVVR